MDSDAARQAANARNHNRRAWDARVERRQRFTLPAPDEDLADPLGSIDSSGWLGASIAGRKTLCLAAGGGRHGVLYAAAGAIVTVVDLSPAMLALDRQAASERGLNVRTVEASMDDLSMLATGEFDLVVQPVSTCYVPDVVAVYREVARVMCGGGIYISQHKQPTSLQADVKPQAGSYRVRETYYRQGPLPAVSGSPHREEGTLEFLHRWEQLIGGLCRCGFVIEDLREPVHADSDAAAGTFAHRSRYFAPYVRIKARRLETATAPAASKLWSPDG